MLSRDDTRARFHEECRCFKPGLWSMEFRKTQTAPLKLLRLTRRQVSERENGELHSRTTILRFLTDEQRSTGSDQLQCDGNRRSTQSIDRCVLSGFNLYELFRWSLDRWLTVRETYPRVWWQPPPVGSTTARDSPGRCSASELPVRATVRAIVDGWYHRHCRWRTVLRCSSASSHLRKR